MVYPLDFAHTRLGSDVGKGATRKFNGLVDCITTVAKKDGVAALYEGFGISLVGIVVYRGAFWGFYYSYSSMTKEWIDTMPPALKLFTKFCILQAVKVSSRIVTYPFETVSQRLKMQSGGDEQLYAGTLDCFSKIAWTEGISGFFKGAGADFIRGASCSFGQILWEVLYDIINAPKPHEVRRSSGGGN